MASRKIKNPDFPSQWIEIKETNLNNGGCKVRVELREHASVVGSNRAGHEEFKFSRSEVRDNVHLYRVEEAVMRMKRQWKHKK